MAYRILPTPAGRQRVCLSLSLWGWRMGGATMAGVCCRVLGEQRTARPEFELEELVPEEPALVPHVKPAPSERGKQGAAAGRRARARREVARGARCVCVCVTTCTCVCVCVCVCV